MRPVAATDDDILEINTVGKRGGSLFADNTITLHRLMSVLKLAANHNFGLTEKKMIAREQRMGTKE